jgi:superfamily II DNA or RNA helicase
MSHTFITNQEKLLSQVINDVIPSTDQLKFLVGFFYFSGFSEICEGLEDKPLKILIGLDIEKTIVNLVKEYEIIDEVNNSRGEVRQRYYDSFTKIFNETDYFDTPEKQNSFKLFVKKIQEGSMEIRKTLHPNHSKLYLFKKSEQYSEGGEYPGILITGSSNLSISGLRNRYELNVILRDKSDFIEGERIFDELWNSAIVIADKDHIETFTDEILERIWFEKIFSPYLLYIRVLYEFFEVTYKGKVKLPQEITKDRYFNLKYQEDAIKLALSSIEKHNGIIIADVVGLGKSIIASSVAHNLNLKTIIIAPPHLVKQWDNDYRYQFDFNAKVFSSGSISKALKFFEDSFDHEERLIIVDEAHKYRNEFTQDYADLHKLCQGNKVMLLTATPFNNRPQDIFSMVKLFQIPSKSTLRTVDNLGYEFYQLIKSYKKLDKARKDKTKSTEQIKSEIEIIADRIRSMIDPLVVRRSRLDLDEIEEYRKDLEMQKIKFPVVNPPELLEYDLKDLKDLYSETLDRIYAGDKDKGFMGTRYKPVTYVKNIKKYQNKIEEVYGDINLFRQSQTNLALFMRRLLVHRFESSVFAFKKSLEYMISSYENILKWREVRGKIPIFKKGYLPDIEEFYATNNDNIYEELADANFEEQLEKLKLKGLFEIDASDIKVQYEEDLKKDIDLLKDIHRKWFEDGIKDDPKTDSFKEILKERISDDPGRKIIVFSEYADTVNYLYDSIKDDFKVFKYSSKDASSKNKDIIQENFDAGIDAERQKDEYDILIATDAISEGYNLHRAGSIFNYDVPYNPTRVIQRVGRINRVNKKVFDELYIFNYFPTDVGESEIRSKEISSLKINMIHALMGEDTKYLTSEEELHAFFKDKYEQELSTSEERSWENDHRNLLNYIKAHNPELLQESLNIPKRTRIQRTVKKDESGVIVFGKKGTDFIFKLGNSPDEDITISSKEAFSLFEAKQTEKAKEVSKGFSSIYEFLKKGLFLKKSQHISEKLKREVIDKLKLFMKELTGKKDYIEDLIKVINLDSLPSHYMRMINKSPMSEFDEIEKEIGHKYLMIILSKARSVDEGEEALILSEELI